MFRTTRLCSVFLLTLGLALIAGGHAYGHDEPHSAAGAEMRGAAQQWLDSLRPELREKAVFEFDGPERTDWHFIPKVRTGVMLKEMSPSERRGAHALLRSALSAKGYLKATTIMSLESVLRIMEADRPGVLENRDQEKYWFAVYGDPGSEGAWGWRVEGHHLSLNFTSHTSTVIATFPAFFGANPAEVRDGPRIGLRALSEEEDVAHELMAAFSDDQRSTATFTADVPRDVIMAPGGQIDLDHPVGVRAAEMTSAQRDLLWQIVSQFASNMRTELADAILTDVKDAGVDNIFFSWAGGLGPDDRHYYRLHGPTFVIEYDKTDPNHIHAVWHSTTNDFGLDVLQRHYHEASHHHAATVD